LPVSGRDALVECAPKELDQRYLVT